MSDTNNAIFTQLFPRLDTLLPQFGLTLNGKHWRASGGTTPCCNHDASAHLYIYLETAFGLKCHRCGGFTHLTKVVAGGFPALLTAAGVSLDPSYAERLATHSLHERALKFCADELWSGTAEAYAALEYLHQRGLTDECLHSVGYGLVSRADRWVQEFGTDNNMLSAADYLNADMADRIICPYRDPEGLIIGYWARARGNTEPKYRYTPGMRKEAPYRLNLADPSKPVVVVEGVLSADILASLGVPNVIAAGGSKFTSNHAMACKELV